MRVLSIIFIFVIVHGYIYSQVYEFERVLPQLSVQERATLLDGTPVSRASKSLSNKELQFLPHVKHADTIRSYVKKTNPTILYEILFFIPNDTLQKKIDAMQSKQENAPSDTISLSSQQDSIIMHYYNLLRNITLFSEIRYTNLKDKNVHPLFNTSHRIISKEERIIISPLPLIRSFPYTATEESTFILQDMPPFGDVVSQYEYVYNANDLSFIGENLTYISYRGFAAVIPRDMFITSQIARTSEGVLIYGLGAVRISGFGIFFGGIINNSFTSRMVGFFDWINSQ